MNSEKGLTYEIISEEIDHQEEELHDTAGTKRSYECTFCKRGFTNAQALGGHMNIHRKDRAKAKLVAPDSSSLPINKFNNDDSMPFPFASEIPNYQPPRPFSILESQRNYQVYFHPQPPAHAFQYDFHHPSSRPLNQDLWGANLSLQIGPSHVNVDDIHQVRRGNHKDAEVDLELRLGHDPY